MGKVVIMDHPLVAHKLTIMRDKNTSVKDFRELVSEIGMLITYEATRDLPMTTKHIETPICEMEAPTLAGRKFVVVPILRAGLGLVDGVLRMVPAARVGHIGMYRRFRCRGHWRDEKTGLQAHQADGSGRRSRRHQAHSGAVSRCGYLCRCAGSVPQ